MAEIYREDIATIDLTEPLLRESVGKTLATGDKLANRIGVRVRRRGQPVDLTGHAVMGYFIRPDRKTVVLEGQAVGDTAYVDIAQACLTERGAFSLAIKVSGAKVTQTLRVLDGSIILTQTDALIDPGEVIPTLDDIFAQIEAMEAATDRANNSAECANQAASSALNTTLYLMGVAAPAIVQSAYGDGVVSVSDSAERSLSGLIVYGKTTQAGTPTPEAPVPMANVGDGGSIGVQVRGKNLFDLSALTKQSGALHEVSGNAVRVSTPSPAAYCGVRIPAITMYAGVEYILSADVSNIVGGEPSLGYLDANTLRYVKRAYVSDGRIVLTYTPTETVHMYACLLVTGATASDGDATFANIQLEVSASATAYENFKDGGSMTAVAPDGLPGIPVSRDGNYIDSTGQQWVCDEIDYTRKLHVKRVGKITLDGTQTGYYMDSVALYRLHLADGIIKTATEQRAFCTHYPFADYANANMPDKHFKVHAVLGEGKDYVYIKDTNYIGNDAWKAHLATDPVTVYYILATPIETPLSPDELTGSSSLTAQYPNTTAYNDAGAGMKMGYVADTKIYIDQRIAALMNA